MEIFQSQLVVVTCASRLISCGQAVALVMPMALDSGSQNTEKPYAIPIHRWMASAAGGTSQRLKPGPAMTRSLVKKPGVDTTLAAVICDPLIRVKSRRWRFDGRGRKQPPEVGRVYGAYPSPGRAP